MAYKIERVGESVVLGEGPHWDVETQCLYYVDMIGNTIHKYNPTTNKHTQASLGVTCSFIIPLEGSTDKFLTSLQRDIVVVTWDGESDKVAHIEKIAEVDTDEPLRNNRLNDGKADSLGRLWTGTMENNLTEPKEIPKIGSMYSMNQSGELKRHLNGIQISNGFAWSADSKKMYYIDSMTRSVEQFDFDLETQSISNRCSIFSLDKHNIKGVPDGQTIDADGNLWVAIFDGSKILKIDPRRADTLLEIIDMPADQVTSVTFGGKNLDELYVTTARCTLFGKTLDPPTHGALYRVTGLGVKGFGGIRARIN